MRRRVIDGAVTAILIFLSFVVALHLSGWHDPGWWAVFLTLGTWAYARFLSTTPTVRTAFIIWLAVLVDACLEWKLPEGGWEIFFPPSGLLDLYGWSPGLFWILPLVVISSNAFGRQLQPEVRPSTCVAAATMASFLHPMGYDITYYHDGGRIVLFLILFPVCMAAWVPIRKARGKLRALYIVAEPAVAVLTIWWLGWIFADASLDGHLFYLVYYYALFFALPAVAGAVLFSLAGLTSQTRSRRGHWLIIPLVWLFCFVVLPALLGSLVGFHQVANQRLTLVPALGALGAALLWLARWRLRRYQANQSETADEPVFIWLPLRAWIPVTLAAGWLPLVV
jgi:hypothetical protein